MTDGSGSVAYVYNNLAQLTSETRNFTGVGPFALDYQYSLTGAPKSIMNDSDVVVSYNYDKAGQVTGVTGSGFGGVSSYASALTYRAFGGLKGLTFGNTRTLSTAYDSRMRPRNVAAVQVLS